MGDIALGGNLHVGAVGRAKVLEDGGAIVGAEQTGMLGREVGVGGEGDGGALATDGQLVVRGGGREAGLSTLEDLEEAEGALAARAGEQQRAVGGGVALGRVDEVVAEELVAGADDVAADLRRRSHRVGDPHRRRGSTRQG